MKSLYLFFCLITLSFTTMQAQQSEAYPSRVNVVGQGVVKIVPDQVLITLRVEHTGKDAISVKRQNDQVVGQVLNFLKNSGIPDTDVQTEYIRLNKNYEYNTKSYNYAANQSISVHLKDLTKYETIMDGLLTSGVNRIDNVVFGSSKAKELEAQARIKAIQNARLKATQYAEAVGQSIGSAIAISEQSAGGSPRPMYRAALMENASDSGPTMAPGELEIQVNVSASFILLFTD